MLALGLTACESNESRAPVIECAAGTVLSAAGDACEPNLAEGVSVSATGQIVIDPATLTETETALAAARSAGLTEGRAEGHAEGRSEGLAEGHAEGRAEGLTEGAASVTPLNCDEGSEVNEAGDACEPTAEYRAAAVEEGHTAGVASVTPLNCADGTETNEAGDACEPTAEYRAAAVEEGRTAGVASVTPLNCQAGTEVNRAGNACVPNLSMFVGLDGDDNIVPNALYDARVCGRAGGAFNPDTGICAPPILTYSCFRGGFCSEAARLGLEVGPTYVGVDPEEMGCADSQEGSENWSVGAELAFRCTMSFEPGSPEWRSFALRLWLCR